jgi:hypothetical protein
MYSTIVILAYENYCWRHNSSSFSLRGKIYKRVFIQLQTIAYARIIMAYD